MKNDFKEIGDDRSNRGPLDYAQYGLEAKRR